MIIEARDRAALINLYRSESLTELETVNCFFLSIILKEKTNEASLLLVLIRSTEYVTSVLGRGLIDQIGKSLLR